MADLVGTGRGRGGVTGIHMSLELHVAHLRAQRGGKHGVCVGTVRDRAQGRPVMFGPLHA